MSAPAAATSGPRILTSTAAHAAGYEITYLPSGRLRVIGPEGERYGRTRSRADLVIEFPGKHLEPLRLRELTLPAELRRATRLRRCSVQRHPGLEDAGNFKGTPCANLDLFAERVQ